MAEVTEALIRMVVTPFLKQGGPVIVALCCNRLYVGGVAAQGCRTCTQPPINVEIALTTDLTTVCTTLNNARKESK